MDHLDAVNMQAVERYVLGDLTVPEVEDFERHFFDCPQCSEELRALAILQENARAVFSEPAPAAVVIAPQSVAPPAPTSLWRGFPLLSSFALALGALLIGIFAGYLAFRGRDSALGVDAYPLYAQARGEETVVAPAAGSKFYVLYLDRTWDGSYKSYRAVLRDASGTERFAVPIEAGATADVVHVLMPSHKLPSGKYTLVMLGGQAGQETELARFPFTLQLK
jgi:hypothetical protein